MYDDAPGGLQRTATISEWKRNWTNRAGHSERWPRTKRDGNDDVKIATDL